MSSKRARRNRRRELDRARAAVLLALRNEAVLITLREQARDERIARECHYWNLLKQGRKQ